MCGIAGAYGVANDGILDEMLSCIRHRGPDEGGSFCNREENVMLGARRLSIVGVENGSQPVANEDGSIRVVFNGEIYNYTQLKNKLQSRGHKFKTATDTEVLVHLWEEYGQEMPEHLNGMFAFAIWDSNSKSVFLARDRLGIKPLYYGRDEETIWWGSEIPTLLAAGIDRSLNEKAIYNYFYLRYSPSPNTLFDSIQKVPPGASLYIDENGISKRQYWKLNPNNGNTDFERTAAHVRQSLEQAVERRLMADVPLGAFLSGGLDSSAIVGLMSEKMNDPVRTFSVGFQADSFDESSEAAMVADHFGTDHQEYTVDLDTMDIFGEMVRTLGEPLADPALLPTTLLSKRAREDVKVVLTGEGADELFGGYWYYTMVPKHRSMVGWAPQPIYNTAGKIQEVAPVGQKYFDYFSALGSDRDAVSGVARKFRRRPEVYTDTDMNPQSSGISKIVDDSIKYANNTTQDKLTSYDLQYQLPDNLLYKVDQATMSASLEARVPFLDHTLVEEVYGLSPKMKTGKEKKALLKHAVRDILPERTLKRKKHGFVVPIDRWFRNESDAISRWLTEDALIAAPYVDHKKVYDLWDAHRRGRQSNEHALWKVLNYVVWHEQFVRGND
jgi:asparagine synthase (glutamine-hydrolysing)